MATAAADARARMQRLPPEVTRVLYVRNLPFKLSSDEMYDIFGKFGPIRQVRWFDGWMMRMDGCRECMPAPQAPCCGCGCCFWSVCDGPA